MDAIQQRVEALGPAERIVRALTTFTDHGTHNRPGIVIKDTRANIGVRWEPVTWKLEGEEKVVYKVTKVGKKITRVRVGILGADNQVREGRTVVGEYRSPGLFPEVMVYMYRQIADVWKLDNEFAARWASWAFPKEHRDLKVILAAFLLVQNRMGEPVKGTDGKVEFFDDDFRDVGEAMCLIRAKEDFNPKLLLRAGDILALEGVAAINRELGFGKSARNPTFGRYEKVVARWLRYREDNPRMLEGLVKAGFRTAVMDLARRVGYKPASYKFFETLRWKQKQAKDGRREMAIGMDVTQAETWEGKTEKQICKIIIKDKPNYKRLVGLLPAKVGLTRAIMAAAIEAGSLSNADLIILTPTLEDLGLLQVPEIQARWKEATDKAENQRAAHIATRVRTKVATDGLQAASDKATAKVIEEVTRGLRTYFIVDKSGSMEGAIERAKVCLTKFLGGFPIDRTHVCVFNTVGTVLTLKSASSTGVEQAFRGHTAGGGTSYADGVLALSKFAPQPDEDTLMIFVGDQEDHATARLEAAVKATKFNPVAFGLLEVVGTGRYAGNGGTIVVDTAQRLGIPCFRIEENLFNDPYTVTRTIRNLIATTPVVATARRAVQKSLVEEILGTPLLAKPAWA